jgi:hypothetical protein
VLSFILQVLGILLTLPLLAVAVMRFRIIDVVNRHGISKENMLCLNRHGYFERVLFDKSIVEFDIGFEYVQQLQPAELFTRPFSVELMDAGFDKRLENIFLLNLTQI